MKNALLVLPLQLNLCQPLAPVHKEGLTYSHRQVMGVATITALFHISLSLKTV